MSYFRFKICMSVSMYLYIYPVHPSKILNWVSSITGELMSFIICWIWPLLNFMEISVKVIEGQNALSFYTFMIYVWNVTMNLPVIHTAFQPWSSKWLTVFFCSSLVASEGKHNCRSYNHEIFALFVFFKNCAFFFFSSHDCVWLYYSSVYDGDNPVVWGSEL